MIYLQLFLEFFKVGLFAVGGAMSTIPFLLDLGAKTGWFTSLELADMLAVSESTPGPIGINMATYVGSNTAGIFGGLISTLGLVMPSIIIIEVIYYLFKAFSKNRAVQFVMKFLRCAVIGLIAYALWQVLRVCILTDGTLKAIPVILIALLIVLINVFKKIHPIVWVLLGAVLGLLVL